MEPGEKEPAARGMSLKCLFLEVFPSNSDVSHRDQKAEFRIAFFRIRSKETEGNTL